MSNGSGWRNRVVSEDLSLTVPDTASSFSSKSYYTSRSTISTQPAQDIVIRGSRKPAQRKEPRHAPDPNGDEKRRLRVYSNREKTYTEINVNVVRDLDECWISEHAVERLDLKSKPNLTGKKEYGCLGLKSFEFRGIVTLQYLYQNSTQPTRCRIVPSKDFEIYMPSNLLPLPRKLSAPEPLSIPLPADADVPLPLAASATTVVNSAEEYTGQFDGDEFEEALDNSKHAKWADDWLLQMEKVHSRKLSGYVRDQDTNPIKIAVLDTGVDSSHNFIKAAKKQNRIKLTKSFVGGVNSQDSHGHGTHVAALLLKIAPDAQLYIAKVASGGKIPGNHKIADAIKWAVEHDVDIITMSFGIDTDHTAMQSEIKEACKKDIIIFAAASNRGRNHPVPYPARRSNEVLCIYATDGLGNAYDGNPAHLETSAYHFATLGVGVKSAWPQLKDQPSDRSGERRKTGTSFATPIAAGIAAYILEFARVNGLNEKSYQMLRTRAGIEIIFVAHLVVKQHDGLHYIHPWRLFAEHRSEEDVLLLIKDTLGPWLGKAGQQSNAELCD